VGRSSPETSNLEANSWVGPVQPQTQEAQRNSLVVPTAWGV